MQKCDDEDDVEENDGDYVLAVSDGLSEDALERTLGVVYERSGRPPGQQVPPPVTPARGGGLGWVPSSVGRWREACRLGVPPRPPPLLLLLHPAQQREPDALRLRHDDDVEIHMPVQGNRNSHRGTGKAFIFEQKLNNYCWMISFKEITK